MVPNRRLSKCMGCSALGLTLFFSQGCAGFKEFMKTNGDHTGNAGDQVNESWIKEQGDSTGAMHPSEQSAEAPWFRNLLSSPTGREIERNCGVQ